MNKIDEKFYRGRFHQLPDRPLNSIRIFISSTFSDTTEERNGLIERVYPRLRDYCSKRYQTQFQYSDMRWGIPSTAANSHSTVEMCLQELDMCCRLSLATNCVIFLSHRYGSRLAPATLSTELFQSIMKFGSLTADEKELLSDTYLYDENYFDGKYFLRTIDDETKWTLTEKKVQEILRKAADVCYQQAKITEEERREFYISVTAQEIYRTLKNNRDKSRRIICFFRELIDIDELDAKYREIDQTNEIESLLNEVKTHLKSSIDPDDIYTYQVRWKDNDDQQKYLSKFFDDFFSAVQNQIDFHMNNHQHTQSMNNLSNQILEHAIQCNSLLQRYFPRDDILDQVKDYILSTKKGSCVLLGESGTGKSSIMAKLVREIPKWFSSDSISVIIRFLGATPSTSDIRRPLISIIEQICQIYRWSMPSTIDNLSETFEEHLINIPSYETLIILLDSIDQLQMSDIEDLSIWLPRINSFSSNVKIIFSTIPTVEFGQKTYRLHEQLRTIYERTLTEIEVNAFDRQLAERVLHSWLKQDRRCLTADQYEWLRNKLTSHWITPLFLSLVYDQTLTWHSYDERIDKKFQEIKRTSDAIGYLYHRLGEKHGDVLVQRSMRYIQISGGLNELELEDILSSDDEVLQSIFVHYLPPWKLFRLPSTLWIRIRNEMQKYFVEKQIDGIPCISFYHRSFQYYQPMNVQQLIRLSEETERMEKVRLEYFSNRHCQTFDLSYSPKLMKKYQLTEPIVSVDRCLTKQKAFRQNLRRLHQLTLNLNRYDFVHSSTIFSYSFLVAYLQNTPKPMSSLLYEFSIGAHDPNGELRYLLKQFERSMQIIDRYPENVAFEMIYRLYPWRNELPDLLMNLLKDCVKRCPLVLTNRTERDECLSKYSSKKINALDIDGLRVFLLNNGNELNVFSWFYYGLFRTEHLVLEKFTDELIDFHCRYPHVCCQSVNDTFTLIDCNEKKVLFETSANRMIDFIGQELLLLISSSKNTLELWNWSSRIKLSIFPFPNDEIESCDYHSSMIQVKCRSNSTIYSISIDEQNQFQLNRTFSEKFVDHSHRICLDHRREFFFSFERSEASLVVYNEDVAVHPISFVSPPRNVFHLKQSHSIIWLTSKSLTIVYSVNNDDVYRTCELFHCDDSSSSIDYDLIHDHYHSDEFRDQYQFFACINSSKSILDIFQWFFDSTQNILQHRQVTHVQFDHPIKHCVFNARWFDGLTIFCTDETNFYKYNGTLATFSDRFQSFVTPMIDDQRLTIENHQYLVHHNDQNSLKIYLLDGKNALETKLSEESIVDFVFRKNSSDVLLVNQQKHLMIYSLNSSTLRWRNEQFHEQNLRLFSNRSSFYLLSLSTRSFYQIHSTRFQITLLLQLPFDCFHSCITTKGQCYFLSSDYRTLLQYELSNQTMVTHEIHLKSIEQIISIGEHLIVKNSNRRISLWSNETKKFHRLEKANLLVFQEQRFVFESIEMKCLVLYDLQAKLRGTIQLEREAMPNRTMCLSDQNSNREQYLFALGNDRLLRIYSVDNGNQLSRLFIHSDLNSLIGIIHNRLILQVNDHLTILNIVDEIAEHERTPTNHSILFGRSMWMTCYDELFSWR